MSSTILLCAIVATGGFLAGWWAAIYLMLTRARDTNHPW